MDAFFWMVTGAGLAGIGIGVMVNHFLVSRPLMQRVVHMRYVGFMNDPKPTFEPVPRLEVRED